MEIRDRIWCWWNGWCFKHLQPFRWDDEGFSYCSSCNRDKFVRTEAEKTRVSEIAAARLEKIRSKRNANG